MVRTVNDLFYRVVDRHSPRVMLHRDAARWIPTSSQELYRGVLGVTRQLLKWKIAKGDRIALLSENRPEWAIADFAAMLLGAVVVPIYVTLTEDQVAHLLRDSSARVAFVSTQQQLDKGFWKAYIDFILGTGNYASTTRGYLYGPADSWGSSPATVTVADLAGYNKFSWESAAGAKRPLP